MAEIDNLNFKVILDDKEFDAKVNADIKLANELNASLSSLLTIKSKIGKFNQDDVVNNRKANQMLVDNGRAQEKITREKIKTHAIQEKLNAQIQNATKSYQSQSRILGEIKNLALGYLSIHGAGQVLSSMVKITGEFELQKTTLAAMLGDLNQAEQVITKIQGLAVESPFQFKELTTYAKQLSAFSVPAQELYDTTKMLADVSAGLGVGMDRIVLAYGQVRSAAFLRGQEVRQFTEAGIPILDELAKQFSELEGRAVSVGEVFDKISARLVPFEMVAKVFKDMTSEGGKFYNMQEVQAETLRGKISNLKDAYEVMLNEIGKGQSENLKGAVDWARKLMQNYEQTGRTLVELVAAYGTYKVALIALEAVSGAFVLSNHKILSSLKGIVSALAGNPYAILAGGIAALGYTIYKSATHLEAYEKIQNSLANTNKKYTKALDTERAKLEALYNKLSLAKEGTEDYNKAKRAIYTQYASYISDLKNEGIAVDNLAGIYDKLTEKVDASVKARFRGVAAEGVNSTYGTATQSILDEAERATERLLKKTAFKLDSLQKQAVQAYVSGVLTMEDLENDSRLKTLAMILQQAAESGNYEWMQFGTSIETAKDQFSKATAVWTKGLADIDEIYGKIEEKITEDGGGLPYIGGADENDPTNKIQAEIDAVRRLKDAYDTLAPYMNGDMLRKTLTALFPNADQDLIQSLDFRAKLVELAAELNKFDQDASQKLLDSISGEKAGEIVSAFKAVETYKSMLDEWLGQDFNLTGEGITYDVNKIVRDLNNQYNQIDQKRLKAIDLLKKAQEGGEEELKIVRQHLGEEAWKSYLTKGSEVIDELARKEKESAKKVADERIKDKANSYLKELLENKNIDLSDFGDKTIGQIRTIISRLEDVKKGLQIEAGNVAQEIWSEDVNESQMAYYEMLLKVIDSLGVKIGDVKVEFEKSLFETIEEGIENVTSLADEIESLGDAMENPAIAGFGKIISGLSSTMKDMLPIIQDLNSQVRDMGFDSLKDWGKLSKEQKASLDFSSVYTSIASVATTALSYIVDAIDGSREAFHKAEMAAIEYANAINSIDYEGLMSSYESIFGTDEYGKAIEVLGKIKEYQDTIKADQQKIGIPVDVPGFFEAGEIIVDMRNGWQKFWGAADDLVHSFNINDYIGEDGLVDGERLRELYTTYGEYMSDSTAEAISKVLGQYDLYVNAVEDVTTYMSSLFGKVADDMAESFITSFKESGGAALEYEDIMDDVASNIAKSVIKSVLLQEVFTDEMEKDAAKKLASGDVAGAIGVVKGGMEAAEKLAPHIQELLQSIEPYLDMGEDSNATDLGEGIKGITEDQANLIASYLNAMRADVSVMRGIQAKYLPAIGESMPTIMEHLAKIEANTFNSSQSTQAILSELRGLITTEPGYTSLRVYS